METYYGHHYGLINKISNMFNQNKTNPEKVRYLKKLFSVILKLPETTILSIVELNCHEPNCPPKETVITANAIGGKSKTWMEQATREGVFRNSWYNFYRTF